MVVSFLAGAAAGVAVAYLLNSDKGGEMLDELRGLTNRLRDNLGGRNGAGQDDLVNDTLGANTSQEDFNGVYAAAPSGTQKRPVAIPVNF